MSETLNSRLVKYITAHIDRGLFLSIDEAIKVAYAKAQSRAKEDFKNTNPSRVRAQLRRYLIDDALAGVLSPDAPSVLQTVPKGEQYVVVCSGNVTLSHVELHENKWARPAKHRTLLAKKNAILEPINFDLFEEQPPALDDALHVVAVVLHPKPNETNQSVPGAVLITVPFTNWSGYHLEMPIEEFIQCYDQNTGSDLMDEAWPTLRDDLQKQEKEIVKKSG